MNKQLHQSPRGFGGSGYRWAPVVGQLVKEFNITSWLDYGCGQSTLWTEYMKTEQFNRPIRYSEYDPAITGKDSAPSPAELVTCTDVLEHIEPKCLDAVLNHLFSLTERVIYLNIAMQAANKKLPDGRNAHLIQKPSHWWVLKLSEHFPKWDRFFLPVPEGRELKDFNLYLVRR